MLLEEKVKNSEVLPFTQNRKHRNLRKFSLTLNFDSCCNLIFRNDKNELRQKLQDYEMD